MDIDIDKLINWFQQNKRDLPWRHTLDPYAIWISEIMLQQTRVETVISYYERFLKDVPTISSLASIEDEKLLKLWEGLGYYSRARNLKRSAQIIIDQFEGKFPDTYENILKLKGIGEYSAGAILSRAFHLPYASVDGNVLRVLTRLNEIDFDISSNKTKKRFKEELEKYHPSDFGVFNESLMELGATICTPKNAKCLLCPLSFQCKAFAHQTIYQYPIKSKKIQNVRLYKTCVFLTTSTSLFYFQAKEEGVLKGLLSPLIYDSYLTLKEVDDFLMKQNIQYKEIIQLKEQNHVFSHQTWLMKGYQVVLEDSYKENSNFYSLKQIKEQISIPICFQKFFKELGIDND